MLLLQEVIQYNEYPVYSLNYFYSNKLQNCRVFASYLILTWGLLDKKKISQDD